MNEIMKKEILGSNINLETLRSSSEKIYKMALEGKNGYICISNVHTVVMGAEDDDFLRITNSALLALPDGMPLVWLAKNKIKKVDRCAGPDLMTVFFEDEKYRKLNHYFYGSSKETIEKLINKLNNKVKIVGYKSPPYRELSFEEKVVDIEDIKASKADILWVGLGAPKQEKWMRENSKNFDDLIMIGVGAGFDFHAGNLKRAPIWMQKASLEWIYRLLQDPKRLSKRYFVYNTKFIYLLIIDYIKTKINFNSGNYQ